MVADRSGYASVFLIGGLAATLALAIAVSAQHSQFSLIEVVGIKQLLEQRLGVTVDITTRDSLDPLLRDRIEASAIQVF